MHRRNASQSQRTTMTRDTLLQSIGFLKPDNLIKHMSNIGTDTVHISDIDKNPMTDPGEAATMNANKHNTKPVKPPSNYSDIWHINIGFGPCTAIGGIRYTLMAVDKKTKLKLVYGLKNLTTSLR